ncbi:YchJ family metal-binding protein [Nonlabens sp.]|uniref:YchJ family protein n=1 Tax=Nonlabens sp. TaxID=1888209 RepID=UPI003264BB20
MKCPCNPEKFYKDCCKKVHQDIFKATTAQELMRSRYSAFVLGNIDYLSKSHHSSTRPSKRDDKETERWTRTVEWVKLDVINHTAGTASDAIGTVYFKAFFIENGSVQIIEENSRFCKENEHWVYLDTQG